MTWSRHHILRGIKLLDRTSSNTPPSSYKWNVLKFNSPLQHWISSGTTSSLKAWSWLGWCSLCVASSWCSSLPTGLSISPRSSGGWLGEWLASSGAAATGGPSECCCSWCNFELLSCVFDCTLLSVMSERHVELQCYMFYVYVLCFV